MTKNIQKNAGFSIIELSIVLTIIALVATTALSVGSSRIESARINSTTERMNFIMEAIELYVKNFGYIPCPSDNSKAITDVDFGNGIGSGDNMTDCTEANDRDTAAGTPGVVIGGVPTQQLNISPAIVVDGWGRRFTYVVDEILTYTGSPGFDDSDGAIIIENTDGGSDITTIGGMVLISHGTNGHGAWTGKGLSQLNKGCGSSADEDTNSDVCGSFNNTFVQRFRTSNYDDSLEFRIKWQFDVD